jgi:hypothetical protein
LTSGATSLRLQSEGDDGPEIEAGPYDELAHDRTCDALLLQFKEATKRIAS